MNFVYNISITNRIVVQWVSFTCRKIWLYFFLSSGRLMIIVNSSLEINRIKIIKKIKIANFWSELRVCHICNCYINIWFSSLTK